MWQVKLTIGIIIAVTLGLIGYDVWAYANSVPNDLDTISGRMKIWALTTPIIPWAWCVLAGHFFGPSHHLLPLKVSISILITLTWAVLLAGIILKSKGIVIPPWTICLPGFVAGMILWRQ